VVTIKNVVRLTINCPVNNVDTFCKQECTSPDKILSNYSCYYNLKCCKLANPVCSAGRSECVPSYKCPPDKILLNYTCDNNYVCCIN